LGRQGNELGQRGPLARARGEAEEKREGEKNWAGWKRRERGEGVKAFSFFFKKKSFQIRFFSNFQTSIKQKSMHSNHDTQTLIISKLF
jgi:hypothetical protein